LKLEKWSIWWGAEQHTVSKEGDIVPFGVGFADLPLAAPADSLEDVNATNDSIRAVVVGEAIGGDPAESNLVAVVEDVEVDEVVAERLVEEEWLVVERWLSGNEGVTAEVLGRSWWAGLGSELAWRAPRGEF
jgi:hypothetical protein